MRKTLVNSSNIAIPFQTNSERRKDTDQSNIYVLVSEWQSQKSMDQHLSGNNFSLLKGAAIVLGKNFKLRVGETKAKNYSQWKRLTLAWQTK